ncbi:leptin receptor-like isoform X1 [Oncorhynchus clarkii lewisi]|uniref:leptin receptor-like isoform X1 n=1 Tax=Oncorhynchus clarkii lewisi TaxID=490388 RepID=UPI0039B92797
MKTMILSAMLTFLVHILIIYHGVLSVEPMQESPHGAVLELPWQTELCCASPPAQRHHWGEGVDEGSAGSRRAPSDPGHPHTPQCLFRNSTSTLIPPQETNPSGATCWDILCRVDETWENVICDLKHRATSSDTSTPGLVTICLQRLVSQPDREVNTTHGPDSMDCVGKDSITCSIVILAVSSIVVVTANVSNTTAGPLIVIIVPPRLGKPSPPVNLTHTQNAEGELVLSWSNPQPHASPVPLSYEVRYITSHNTSNPNWKHVEVTGDQWLSLNGLRVGLHYIVQIHSHHPALPHLWSDWSQPHHIYLEDVTYLPERVAASLGDSVTVHCVFNDRRVNASTAVWFLNLDRLPQSQYTAVNDRVSKITVQPSEQKLYDILRCCQPSGEKYSCNYRYATIYIKDPVIDISCVTNGDLDSMTCRWNNIQTKINFLSRVADLSCDVMEEAEAEEEVGGAVGVVRQAVCVSSRSREVKSCTLQPIRVTSCYKLWMEAKTDNGTRSHPVYITPMDHVKPHPPSGLEAVSMPSGVLRLAWVPPELPLYDMQYQVRYALSTGRAHPFWQVLASQAESWAEVPEPDVCRVYNVQVRCMHINRSGTWSDWSHTLYTTPHNSRAPDQGPDFWRVFQEDPARNQTNVTLLFKHFPIVEPTYCVEGLVVQHQASGGIVTEERIGLVSSYRFEWREEVHSVTVKAQNSQGYSTRNINMTLERHPKRQCVRSFCVSRVNSSCVVLSWSLQPNSSVPCSLVVEWSGQNHENRQGQTTVGRERWTRVPPTDQVFYLHGDFYGSEEYVFILYPVFTDGEGEPVYTKAFRGANAGPAAYMLMMIIAFLAIVLFVTLVISQNHMKKFMWKDVPNPSNCSWAQGVDFRKAETMEQLFRQPEGLPAWPPLLISETISQATIVEKTCPPAPDKDSILIPASTPSLLDLEVLEVPEEEETPQPLDLPRSVESSSQSTVTYAMVLLSDEPCRCYKQNGSLSRSSDEGNYSANNSDISGSFPGGLWELENSHSRAGESDLDPQCSCSYNYVEEFSETSEQEDEALGGERDGGIEDKDLYYLGMGYQEESEEEEEEKREENTGAMLLKEAVVLRRKGSSIESNPLLGCRDSMFSESSDEAAVVGIGMISVPLYLPQFRTAPSRPLKAQGSTPKL